MARPPTIEKVDRELKALELQLAAMSVRRNVLRRYKQAVAEVNSSNKGSKAGIPKTSVPAVPPVAKSPHVQSKGAKPVRNQTAEVAYKILSRVSEMHVGDL